MRTNTNNLQRPQTFAVLQASTCSTLPSDVKKNGFFIAVVFFFTSFFLFFYAFLSDESKQVCF